MRRKLQDRTIVTFLAIFLVAEVLLLLGHIGLLPFVYHNRAVEGGGLAGHIVHAENDLRRRSADSLVWENYSDAQPVFFHDSVLTLSQSAATLELLDKTQVHMSENTLVTIEPRDKDHPGEIRLKFRKGGIRTSNPSAAAQVDAETWSLAIKVGSDVDIRRNGDTYEALVRGGEAKFQNAAGERTLSANQMVKISGLTVAETHIDQELKWQNLPPTRIYSHVGSTDVTIGWQGNATRLVHQSGEREDEQEIAGQTKLQIPLSLGKHMLYLKNGQGTSLPLELQVWKAPIIHLLSPLPRDRVPLERDVPFLWTFLPSISKYRWEMQGHDLHLDQALDDNTTHTSFRREDDAQWGVVGFDKEGFEIPPPYRYPLYIRERPFAAPKLKSPTLLRKPANANPRGASWLQPISEFLLPQANAEEGETFEAIFEWESVAGADQYVVEISDSPDFRNLLLTKVCKQAKFAWRSFPAKKIYWRVAAGSSQGRMGVFSEPAIVNLQNAADGAGNIDGIHVRKIEIAAPIVPPKPPVVTESVKPLPMSTPSPVPPPVSPAPPAAIVHVPLPDKHVEPGFLLAWRPSYSFWDGSGNANTHAQLGGGSLIGLSGDWRHALSDDRFLRVEFDMSEFKDQPQPAARYPFQSDLSWTQLDTSAFWHCNYERLGYGVVVQENFGIQRAGDESVSVKQNWSVGPAVEGLWTFHAFEYIGDVSMLAGTEDGLATKQQLRWRFHRAVIGGSVQGQLFLHSGGSDRSATGSVLLGFEF